MSQTFHAAEPTDRPAIKALLSTSNLPVSDLPESLDGFLVLFDGEILAACGGVETLDPTTGLVRSLAVAPPLRGQGIASALLDRLEARARTRGLAALYMLTTTIGAFAQARGYRSMPRESAPRIVRDTAQFQGLCPGSAILLVKELT